MRLVRHMSECGNECFYICIARRYLWVAQLASAQEIHGDVYY